MEKSLLRRWDWLSGWLFFMLIQVAAARLVTTDWTKYLYFAETLAALGTFLGLALGASQYTRRIVIWFVIDYTLLVFPWQITNAADINLTLSERFLDVGGRLLFSLGQFLQRQPVKDSLFFVAFVGLAFWTIAVVSGYYLIRHRNVLAAIIPITLAILIIQIYDNNRPNSSWWIAVYILIALLLLGREYYLKSQKEWIQRHVFISEEAWSNIFGGLFTIVTLSVLIAWLLPTSLSSLKAAADSWNGLTKPALDRLSNAVTSLNSPYGNGGGSLYGNILDLGRNAAQGDSTIFTVQVLNRPGFISRYYWRGRVYDHYNNGQWTNASTSKFDFRPAGGNISIPNADGRSEALFDFTFEFPAQNLLYAPSQPVWVDHPGSLAAVPVEGSEDVLSWDANPAIQTGDHYQVRAKVTNPDVDQLRLAGTDYPQWILDRYLQVPDNIRPDIQALAKKITTGRENPFDQASAITDYLRANIEYSTDLSAPPQGRDPLLWLLFDYKKGFCNYYASAEVMLLRSIGIPARFAAGFAQGENVNGEFVVRQHDAHAWPEVYFPNIGWVEFEPTTSQSPLGRPSSSQAKTQQSGNSNFVSREKDQSGVPPPELPDTVAVTPPSQPNATGPGRAFWISLALFLAGAAFLSYHYRLWARMPAYVSKAIERSGLGAPAWIENWSRWSQLLPVERAFASINLSLRWLGKPQPIHATPAERAALLKKLLPSAEEHIEALASELESGLFTPHPADEKRARRAGFTILLLTLRDRLLNFLGGTDSRDVYSR